MNTSRSVGSGVEQAAARLDDAIHEIITEHGLLGPGEVAVHFDLVVSTRCYVDGHEVVRRRHWTAVGADPHLSYGMLHAQAKQIAEGLT
jgi:hypothetical protein